MPTLSSKTATACYADHDSGGDQRLAAVWLETAAYYAARPAAMRVCINSGSVATFRPLAGPEAASSA